jgi:hypothetical protein
MTADAEAEAAALTASAAITPNEICLILDITDDPPIAPSNPGAL